MILLEDGNLKIVPDASRSALLAEREQLAAERLTLLRRLDEVAEADEGDDVGDDGPACVLERPRPPLVAAAPSRRPWWAEHMPEARADEVHLWTLLPATGEGRILITFCVGPPQGAGQRRSMLWTIWAQAVSGLTSDPTILRFAAKDPGLLSNSLHPDERPEAVILQVLQGVR